MLQHLLTQHCLSPNGPHCDLGGAAFRFWGSGWIVHAVHSQAAGHLTLHDALHAEAAGRRLKNPAPASGHLLKYLQFLKGCALNL